MKNLSFDLKGLANNLLSRFPGGIYTAVVTFFDRKDANMLTIRATWEHITVDRETF